MEEKTPRVSIGLPVYNGERYLKQAVDSILAQTFTDFELIICDNASTDSTAEICQQYAAQDSRVRYHRNSTNIGGANNSNLTFEMAKAKYFRLAAHDDICAPKLIEQCMRVLENDPSVILCYTMIIDINENGEVTKTISNRIGVTGSIYKRFYEISSRKHACEPIYGVIRTDILRKTPLLKNYTDSDRTLLCELALYGKFFEVPEPLFYKRFHPANLYLDWRTRMAWFNEAYIGKIVFPNWMQFFDFYIRVFRAPLSIFEKLSLYLLVTGPIFISRFRVLMQDLKFMYRMLLHSPQWRKKKYRDTTNWS
jgi:glycosyltransferase involved in cell wall biosynthesis